MSGHASLFCRAFSCTLCKPCCLRSLCLASHCHAICSKVAGAHSHQGHIGHSLRFIRANAAGLTVAPVMTWNAALLAAMLRARLHVCSSYCVSSAWHSRASRLPDRRNLVKWCLRKASRSKCIVLSRPASRRGCRCCCCGICRHRSPKSAWFHLQGPMFCHPYCFKESLRTLGQPLRLQVQGSPLFLACLQAARKFWQST